MVDEAKLLGPILSTFEAFIVQCVVMEKNWAISVDQDWLQALQFSMHLIDLLSIILRCIDAVRLQKAVVDQTGSRLPNMDHDLFFGTSFTLGSVLELLLGPTTELVIAGC